ncbi:hypothetical protein AX15_007117 [Amanita polypyramis BW_CC]|nr:hypothetical protein AX15_007117 [Amanita polypyramis BW_CC]
MVLHGQDANGIIRANISTLNIGLTIHSGYIIPPHGFTIKKNRYTVNTSVGTQSGRTRTALAPGAECVVWSETFKYNICKGDQLSLELYCSHDHRPTHVVGSSKEVNVLSLLSSRDEDHTVRLYDGEGTECGTISIRLETFEHTTHTHYPLERIKKLGVNVDALDESKIETVSPSWTNLLFSLGSLTQLVKNFTQMVPQVHLAVAVVGFALEMAVKQTIRDKKVQGLIETMATIYHLLLESNPLEKVDSKSFRDIIGRLLEATIECAIFVANYCKTKSFTLRVIRNALANVDYAISTFEKTFDGLRMEFVAGTSMHTTIYSIRILEKIDEIARDLGDINISINLKTHGNGWDRRNTSNRCLQGSRPDTLKDITTWAISQRPSAPIYLLIGPEGCGKTCIANTVAAIFDGGRRLGASVFLDRIRKEDNNPTNIFTSIARQLAAFDDKLKLRISKAINDQPTLITSGLGRQLRGLIIEPLNDLTIIGPIVVVIDGLDVLENRDRILSVLRDAKHLPQNLRILITTRRRNDIVDNLKHARHCHQRRITVDGKKPSINDVPSYSRQCLEILHEVRPAVFADRAVDDILKDFLAKFRGVYLFISVAIRFLAIVSDDTAGAFLTKISSFEKARTYVRAKANLERAIHGALDATLPLGLKSGLSIGGAMALGVAGLRSDMTDVVLKTMVKENLLDYDDDASRFLSSILHPASKNANGNHQCAHTEVKRASGSTDVCMAHICIDFLCARLPYDVCSRTGQITNHGEAMIDPRLRKKPPEHLQNYVSEAYDYACKLWMKHLVDVRNRCNISLLKRKTRTLSRHLVHLLDFSEKNNLKTNVLEKFLVTLRDSKVFDRELWSQVRDLKTRIEGSKDRPRDDHENARGTRRGLTMVRQLSENYCLCPIYPPWKVAGFSTCSLTAPLEYTGMPGTTLICLRIFPPIVPMMDESGRVRRVIKEVNLTVDRTASSDKYSDGMNDTEVGVMVVRPNNGLLPPWARKCPIPILPTTIREQEGFVDIMEKPWLKPSAGDATSVVVVWEGDIDMDYQPQFPAKIGDQLGIVIYHALTDTEFSIKSLATLEVKYAQLRPTNR